MLKNYFTNHKGKEFSSLPVKFANNTANNKHAKITITNKSNENISPFEKGLLSPIELAILESAVYVLKVGFLYIFLLSKLFWILLS